MTHINGTVEGLQGPLGGGAAYFQSGISTSTASISEISIGEVEIVESPSKVGSGGLSLYFEEAIDSPTVDWGEWQSANSGWDLVAAKPASFTFTSPGIYGVTVCLHVHQTSGSLPRIAFRVDDSFGSTLTEAGQTSTFTGSSGPYVMQHAEVLLQSHSLPATLHIWVWNNGNAGIFQHPTEPWYRRCTIVKKG